MTETTTDDLRYPCRDETFHGRGVWPLGEDGEAGVVVEGHDRRAWAALNAWARHDQTYNFTDVAIQLHTELDGPATTGRPKSRWATFRESCGCTDEQHADHEFRIRESDESDRADLVHVSDCPDITDRTDCYRLPPCADTFAWVADYHDESGDGAAPVLVWDWT